MVIKVYEYPDYFVEYDVEDWEVTFTDNKGKEVTLTSLSLYDPWLWDAMGWETKRDAAKWWVKNRENEALREAPYFFACTTYRFFDQNCMFWGGDYKADIFDYRKAYRYFSNVDTGLAFIKNGQNTPETSILFGSTSAVEKPTCTARLRYGGAIDLTPKEEVDQQDTPTKWSSVLNYSFKMNHEEFKFFRKLEKESTDIPFYGMELEVSTKLSSKELYRIVTEVEPKQKPFFIFKQDSSISGQYGHCYEIVTVPCSRRYLRKQWRTLFEKINKLCQSKGLELKDVFDTRGDLSNGLHIHVSKDKFLGDFHRRKFMAAYNQWNDTTIKHMTKVSGRPFDKFNQNSYCPVSRDYDGRTLARRLKKGMYASDRAVCHGQNSATLEVRLYQGIVDLNHILRCLDHVDAMFWFTNQLRLKDFDYGFVNAFEEFVIKGGKYKSIRDFILGAA